MNVLIRWEQEARDKGYTDFVLIVDDYPFDEPKTPLDPERRKAEEFTAVVVRKVLTYQTGYRPVVGALVGDETIMPRETSPWWHKITRERQRR